MLNWVIPLDVERSLKVLMETFYSKVAKKCVPQVQTAESIEFRTRYASFLSVDSKASTNFSEHYPFDQVLLRPLCTDDSLSSEDTRLEKEAEVDEAGVLATKLGLLKDVVVISEKNQMSHSYRATFGSEATINLVQIYFSDQQSALYKLDVIVQVGSKLVFHQSMNESSFARYVRYKRSG